MLTIQPNFTNYSVRPSFRGVDKQQIQENQEFYRDGLDAIDEVINNDYVPEKIKKPFKFFRVIGNAALTGLAVFGSAIGIGGFLKKGQAKVANAKVAQKATKAASSAANFVGEHSKNLANKIIEFVKNTKLGKKISNAYEKFASNRFGKSIIKAVNVVKDQVVAITNKIIAPFKSANYEKTTKTTATVLGTGSGLASGYEEFIKESPVEDTNNAKNDDDDNWIDVDGDEE